MAAGGKKYSSEGLLDQIRGKGKADAAAQAAPAKGDTPAGKAPTQVAMPKPRKGAVAGSGTVVGVDIGPDSLRMAKMQQSGGRAKLLGITRVPYGPQDNPEEPGFANFLAGELRKFGVSKSMECWSLISSAKAELWHILIPKVPAKDIPDAVYWTVKKEKQFDEREFILDFEVQPGEVMEKGQPKLSIMVYLAPRKQLEDLKGLFNRAGVGLTGATISPIAIQTLFRSSWMHSGVRTFAHLYVGRNWSRIDIFIDNNIVLSRGIKAGTNSMAEALMENYNMMDRHGGAEIAMPGDSVINLQIDDDTAIAPGRGVSRTLNMEQAKSLLRSKLLGMDVPRNEPGGDIGEQDVLRMIRPAVERLVRQVERTFEYHTTTMGKDRVEKIFFSGEICTNQTLIDFIHSQLGIPHDLLDPLSASAQGGGQLSPNDRLDYNLVVALSLSSNAITPNLLHTFKEKAQLRQLVRFDRMALVVFLALLAVLVGIWLVQQKTILSKEAELEAKKQELARFVPNVNQDELLKLARQVNEKYANLKRAAKIYEGIGVVQELATLTPDEVRIVSMDMDFGPELDPDIVAETKKKGGQKKTERQPRTLIIDGVILSNPEDYDLILTSFLIRLENSKLFGLPIIHKKAQEDFSTSGQVLRFTVHVSLV